MTFSITGAAAQEILAAAVRSGSAGMALRVAARPAADGLEYGMGFDEAGEGDQVQVFGGLTVLVASPSRAWLEGTVLDYVEIEPGRHDFIFIAPPGGRAAATSGKSAAGNQGCGGGGCAGCSR